jgi:hypothetical protein
LLHSLELLSLYGLRSFLKFLQGMYSSWKHTREERWHDPSFDDPICVRCLQDDESATHILCDCEAIAYIRFHHLDQFFMEPSDFYDTAIKKSYITCLI